MERAGALLKQLLQSLFNQGELEHGEGYHSFFSDWKTIAGPKLYSHTKPVDIKNKCLVIEVDHPGWLQIARFGERTILRKIKESYPQLEISTLRFFIKSEPQRGGMGGDSNPDVRAETTGNSKDNTELHDMMNQLYKSIQKKNNES